MDPVSFRSSPFDLIGKWRETDGGLAVNATGRLADGTVLDGPASLRKRCSTVVTPSWPRRPRKSCNLRALGRRVEYAQHAGRPRRRP